MRLLPRLLHTPGQMAAYPLCDVLAAAAWRHHALACNPAPGSIGLGLPQQTGGRAAKGGEERKGKEEGRGAAAMGWLAVRRCVLEAGAGSSLGDMAVGLLGRQAVHNAPRGRAGLGGSHAVSVGELARGQAGGEGVVPDLEADVFQGIDL